MNWLLLKIPSLIMRRWGVARQGESGPGAPHGAIAAQLYPRQKSHNTWAQRLALAKKHCTAR